MTRPVAQDSSKTGDWVKWAVGFAYGLIIAVGSYTVAVEHRLTAQETDLSGHKAGAAKAESEIRARLDSQDATNTKILDALGKVETGVAKINGYLEARRAPQNQ